MQGEANASYARYGESVEGVVRAIEDCAAPLAQGRARAGLRRPASCARPARKALDCALWDLEAEKAGRSAAELAGLAPLQAVKTALHDLAFGAGGDGSRRRTGAGADPLLKLELAAWRRGTARGRARRGASGPAHRRRQRGLAAGRFGAADRSAQA